MRAGLDVSLNLATYPNWGGHLERKKGRPRKMEGVASSIVREKRACPGEADAKP